MGELARIPEYEAVVAKVNDSFHSIRPMSDASIARVEELEALVLSVPQVPLHTHHMLHAGMYARTIDVPPETILTGVHIRIATILVASGDFNIHTGDDEPLRMSGENMVVAASAGRKQAVRTYTHSRFTMLFPTTATTVEEAEREFTDEYDKLMSHGEPNTNEYVITGER